MNILLTITAAFASMLAVGFMLGIMAAIMRKRLK